MTRSVIVVGAGVLGCALADELIRRGATVTVVDAAEAGSGTSAATFAWINAHNKAPEAYRRLNVLGLEAHQRAAERWFHRSGTIELAHSGAQLDAVARKVRRFTGLGYAAELLTPSALLALEPSLSPDGLAGGARYAAEGWIDVPTMCLTLLHRAIAAGAVHLPHHRVEEIRAGRVVTDRRVLDADTVVLAAGNGSRALLRRAGIDFPVADASRASVGIISTTAPVDAGITHLVRAEGIALRPARNGGITYADQPTGGKWALDDPRIWTVPALLLDRARRLFPALHRTTTQSVGLGTRVLPEDGLTIADWVGPDHRTYAVATHSGVTLSAHLAAVVADEVLTGRRDESLREFGLSRFAGAGSPAQ
ncbi:NAD(P)/FAD-dependent oxidoreductase [Cryptosporangium arvum]|uniref:NAD(P)/FAD-dependent oxidoreductase n=1 Tax=Cryptosporangium arvum TaxID=80871 RepID=UPI0004B2DA32|nr:FAD-dependent oxidoreductase [Cryptosporangium arvum]